jgi:hypothetical protein
VVRGPGAWRDSLDDIRALSRSPLLLGRSTATASLRQQCINDLAGHGVRATQAELVFDCCSEDLDRLISNQPSLEPFDAVVAIGGGKVMDAGQLLANRLGIPCVTVPTSAATCAGWTALANLYSPQGAFRRDVALPRCPELLVFDHDLVRTAPPRTLASGIADAMAKWYEASVSSGSSDDGLVQQALQGLAFAHEAGLAHHDLQPFLMLVSDRGQLRVAGLAIAAQLAARQAAAAAPADTPSHSGRHGERVAAERDVLATGVLLHGVLAGAPALDEPVIGRIVDRLPPLGRDRHPALMSQEVV